METLVPQKCIYRWALCRWRGGRKGIHVKFHSLFQAIKFYVSIISIELIFYWFTFFCKSQTSLGAPHCCTGQPSGLRLWHRISRLFNIYPFQQFRLIFCIRKIPNLAKGIFICLVMKLFTLCSYKALVIYLEGNNLYLMLSLGFLIF